MFLTFRLLLLVWAVALCSCTPKQAPPEAPPAYKENPY